MIYTEEKLKEAVKNSLTYSGVCRYLNLQTHSGNIRTVKRQIKKFNIDCSNIKGRSWNKGGKTNTTPKNKISLDKILVKNSTYMSSSKLNYRLIKEGIKENKCECCGINEWMNKPISLQLHHINGISDDNRIENLQLLCPNCHTQTNNYGSKNKVAV